MRAALGLPWALAVSPAAAVARPKAANCSVAQNTAIDEPDIKFYSGITDSGACCTLCDDFAGCGAFTSDATGCALKAGADGRAHWKPAAGATSGDNANEPGKISVSWHAGGTCGPRSGVLYLAPTGDGNTKGTRAASCGDIGEYYELYCELTSRKQLIARFEGLQESNGPAVDSGCSYTGRSTDFRCCFGDLPTPAPTPAPTPVPHAAVPIRWTVGWASAGGTCGDRNGTYTLDSGVSSAVVASCVNADGDTYSLTCSVSAKGISGSWWQQGPYGGHSAGCLCDDMSDTCPEGHCCHGEHFSTGGYEIFSGDCCW